MLYSFIPVFFKVFCGLNILCTCPVILKQLFITWSTSVSHMTFHDTTGVTTQNGTSQRGTHVEIIVLNRRNNATTFRVARTYHP